MTLFHVVLLHRGRHSLPPVSGTAEPAPYHWALYIHQSSSSSSWSPSSIISRFPIFHILNWTKSNGLTGNVYDITNGFVQDEDTGKNINPNMDWTYRARGGSPDSLWPGRVVLVARIGQGANRSSVAALDRALQNEVRLPSNGSTGVRNGNCVSWVLDALKKLMERGQVAEFDIRHFETWVMRQGCESLARLTAGQPGALSKRLVLWDTAAEARNQFA